MVIRRNKIRSRLGCWLLLIKAKGAISSTSSACAVCLNGDDSLYVNQTKTFSVEGLPFQTCGQLLQTAPLLQQGASLCNSIQAVGTYCGCPRAANACTLCENGTAPSHPLLELSSLNASDYIFGAPAGVKLNCETLDSVLNYQATEGDAICSNQQSEFGNTCGCPFNNSTIKHTNNATGGGDQGKMQPVSNNTVSCRLCLDGSSPRLPNRTIDLSALPVRNCKDLESFASLLSASDAYCGGLQSFGAYCGCPVPPGACSFCPNGEAVPFPDKKATLLESFHGFPPGLFEDVAAELTCGEFASILAIPPPSSLGFGVEPGVACFVGQYFSGECGCSVGIKAKVIIWLYRVSAALSLIGSILITHEFFSRSPDHRSTYHHLMLAISCYDVVTSVAYMLTGVLVPTSAGQYESHGNGATCKLQGFLIQLGATSLFYNLLLSVYFLLLVNYNWKERRFRKYRNYVHVPILVAGIALSVAATYFDVPQLSVCFIAIPPETINFLPITLLFTVPTGVALVTIVSCNVIMCYHVYSTEKATLKWSGKQNLALTKKVVWQALFYCGVFIVTLPYVTIYNYLQFRGQRPFRQFAFLALFSPSQGFLNCLIFFQRDRAFRKCCTWYYCCCRRKSTTAEPTPDSQSNPQDDAPEVGTEEPSQLQENITYDSATDERPVSESDDMFSAPAEHWMMTDNVSLRSISARSLRAGSIIIPSFRNMFRREGSAGDALNYL